MRKPGLMLLAGGGLLTVLAVCWQAFTISAYVRGAGDGALDAHGFGSGFVHLGQLAIVIGIVWAWAPDRRAIGLAAGYLVLSSCSWWRSATPTTRAAGSTAFTDFLRWWC